MTLGIFKVAHWLYSVFSTNLLYNNVNTAKLTSNLFTSPQINIGVVFHVKVKNITY